ncbi:MAG: TIR domain-containing protein [Chitinophagales bacterium]|jgi:hypothetical protein|nr:TIR domain-containing protein [Chitinophagales bacterium]
METIIGTAPTNIFLLYVEKDIAYLEQLKKHLAVLERQRLIALADESDVLAGQHIDQEIKRGIEAADLVLALISSAFLSADYPHYNYVMYAMQHNKMIVPILLRPCEWKQSPWKDLKALPRNGKYLSQSRNKDKTLYEIVTELRLLLPTQDTARPLSFEEHAAWQQRAEKEAYQEIFDKRQQNTHADTSEPLKQLGILQLDEETLSSFWQQVRVKNLLGEHISDTPDPITAHNYLKKLSLATNGSLLKGTVLCFGKAEQMHNLCQTATETNFVFFKGSDRANDLLDMQNIGGNLIQQYETCMSLLQKHIPLSRDRQNSLDFYEIPMAALKELVANAFVHRTYAKDTRSYIQIELFDDRIVIKSPGAWPPELDMHRIEASFFRNPVIAAIFRLYGYIDKIGTGIQKAQRVLHQQGLQPAQIESLDRPPMVKVTIHRPQRTTQSLSRNAAQQQALELLEREQIADLFDLIDQYPPDNPLLQQLKREYVSGMSLNDPNFMQRLRVLIKLLFSETP